jgi:hypothetical protein
MTISNNAIFKGDTTRKMEVDKFFNFKRKATALQLRDLGNVEEYVTAEDKEKLQGGPAMVGGKNDSNRPPIVNRVAVFIDAAAKKYVEKREIANHLQHLGSLNIVEYDGKYYIQKTGLPQGLNISGVMSSFYYACLEEEALGFLKKQEERGESIHLIMRLTDDYLIVTNKKESAIKTIENLVALSKKYDFQFNMKKLTTNFYYASALNENDVVTSQNFSSSNMPS